MMKWTHLPVGGGLYDQHPKFLEDMFEIAQVDVAQQVKDQKQQQAQAAASKASGRAKRRR